VPPLSAAVICAAPSAVNEPAVAVKLAVAAPASAVIEAGTVTLTLLELTGIVMGTDTGPFRPTEQTDVPPGFTKVGLQTKPVKKTGWIMAIVPLVAETGMLAPVESDRTACVIWIDDVVLVVPGAILNVN
jgi:hypothetical protein